ncbi:hypothetical protein DAEQUDRAFT_441041 [Daedalea quercina L-15889]|uniref:Uncharacterized protein n=1 Tax=Daedalea quercina L-15889 TaxID=1314783 RepID=A0A165NC85_9APHY|nr:hypothetical protein DAEQUDRAFT_441041 [Daedalea quercina L-15889]
MSPSCGVLPLASIGHSACHHATSSRAATRTLASPYESCLFATTRARDCPLGRGTAAEQPPKPVYAIDLPRRASLSPSGPTAASGPAAGNPEGAMHGTPKILRYLLSDIMDGEQGAVR